ncbi:MAG: tRNA (5-methylaminomethyl-2-thiouridine)(34)-methyltransferase MnmD [Bacteroidales bacterium]|nr:tRNA (5-methylaminomethyl-2-thiouridine)(34)-methyltransferase MnmD [Bacteroidales bacterium]
MQLKIINTEDGSTSLYNEELNESYHSKFGAINESTHVFIEAGLNSIKNPDTMNILEIGLGTGLNALLTCIMSKKNNINMNYIALEPYPIKKDIYDQMNFEQCLIYKNTYYFFTKIHEVPWDQLNNIHSGFKINKLNKRLEDYQPLNNFFNLIYFDAFSPDIQPEMWTMTNFTKLFKSLQQHGVLVTYSAKGDVR